MVLLSAPVFPETEIFAHEVRGEIIHEIFNDDKDVDDNNNDDTGKMKNRSYDTSQKAHYLRNGISVKRACSEQKEMPSSSDQVCNSYSNV